MKKEKSNAVNPKKVPNGTAKIEEVNGETLIWDVPPVWPVGLEKNMLAEEESNFIWVPRENEKIDPLDYGSDDLRSISTVTLSTQSDCSDLMGSTQSDVTVPDRADDNFVFPQERHEFAEFPNEAKFDKESFLKEAKYGWALMNRMQLHGYRNQEQIAQKEKECDKALEVIHHKREEHSDILKKEEDLKAREEWDRWLEKDMAEVLRRRINQEEICRIQMMKQELEERLVDEEKATRSALDNAKKYITESFVNDPDEEVNITNIAFDSVANIDNYIQSSHQDHWDHLYRCQSDRYTHDWARIKMSKDEESDCDFYDACYVYPWHEVFHKVMGKYMNRMISASSPMFNATVGILWHWIFEHEVHFVVMLNQYLERGIQTSVRWYPEKVGEKLCVRRSAIREYFIECTSAKTKFKATGVQRTFTVTQMTYGEKTGERKMKVLHMWDWMQDGQPDNWQSYVKICERVNRESLKAPVVIMSKHGCGRSMALILALMGAIMVRLDDDVSIHAMVHGARASKRHAITSFHHVYFWRQVHYELLFRWFVPLRHLRTNMKDRFSAWQEQSFKFKEELHDNECDHFWDAFENELNRYKRMRFMSEYLRNMAENKEYELREDRKPRELHDAVKKGVKTREYVNLKPVRRKALRQGDKPRNKKTPLKHLKFEEFSPKTQMYIDKVIEPVTPQFKSADTEFDGFYEWVKPSEEKNVMMNGAHVPENWKYWMTKEQQGGVMNIRFI